MAGNLKKLTIARSSMDYEGLVGLVKTRRSIRSFKTDSVSDEDVDKIIEVARWAPSGANSQPWEFIVLKDKETKDRIVDIVKEQSEHSRRAELTRAEDLRFPGASGPIREPGYKNAPVFIILCGDPRTIEAYPLLTSYIRGDSHFASGLASAFLYMSLAATTLGLGSQWVSATGHPYVKCLLGELLEIPERLVIYDMMALGYPAHQPKGRFIREKADMVHYGRYDRTKYRSNTEIRNYIAGLRK
jgi:5,6-dimethylbenzimidazole synthase